MNILFFASFALAGTPAFPPMQRPVQSIVVEAVLPHSAAAVWDIVAGDYGKIAESHPKIVRSDYVGGSLVGGLGVERTCWFNEAGTQELHEQIVGWEPEQGRFQNRILSARGFPLDPDNTLATYSVQAVDAGHTRMRIEMSYRTRPALMGGVMKGAFSGLLEDYLVAVHGRLASGQPVTGENFAAIARTYGEGVAFVR
jgi:hypothetical protein